jgi:hypothetical protein
VLNMSCSGNRNSVFAISVPCTAIFHIVYSFIIIYTYYDIRLTMSCFLKVDLVDDLRNSRSSSIRTIFKLNFLFPENATF